MDALEFDDSLMYFGYDYDLTDKIKIHSPTVGDIIQFGEKKYYAAVFCLTAIPSDMKHQLEDLGFNYMNVSDYELFLFLSKSITQESTRLLLGDLDLSKMEVTKNEENGEVVLADPESGAVIDRFVHYKMAQYIRMMHGIIPKVEKAANETTRQILIKLSREKAEKAEKEPHQSQIKPMVSALMRNPACTESFEGIKNMPLCTVVDTLQGVQVFTATNALLIGAHSGMVDVSKIPKKEFDWMRSIQDTEKTKAMNNALKSNAINQMKPKIDAQLG